MKFPGSHTCGFIIMKSIYDNGAKPEADIVNHLTSRFSRYTMAEKMTELLTKGMLIEADGKLTISLQVRRHFDQCEEDASPIESRVATTSTATPRGPRPFKPLTGYKLNKDGMREGAGDHRNWPSRHLPE